MLSLEAQVEAFYRADSFSNPHTVGRTRCAEEGEPLWLIFEFNRRTAHIGALQRAGHLSQNRLKIRFEPAELETAALSGVNQGCDIADSRNVRVIENRKADLPRFFRLPLVLGVKRLNVDIAFLHILDSRWRFVESSMPSWRAEGYPGQRVQQTSESEKMKYYNAFYSFSC